MATPESMQEIQELIVSVPAGLRQAFELAAARNEENPGQTIARLMQEFVELQEELEPEYEQWFRAEVEASLNEPPASIPHADVVRRSRERRAQRLADANRAA